MLCAVAGYGSLLPKPALEAIQSAGRTSRVKKPKPTSVVSAPHAILESEHERIAKLVAVCSLILCVAGLVFTGLFVFLGTYGLVLGPGS